VPDSTDAAALSATGLTIRVYGWNPTLAWVLAAGFDVGTTHPAIRWDAAGTTNGCGAYYFEVTDVDEEAGWKVCH